MGGPGFEPRSPVFSWLLITYVVPLQPLQVPSSTAREGGESNVQHHLTKPSALPLSYLPLVTVTGHRETWWCADLVMLGSEERGRVGWVRLTAAKSVEAVLRTGKGLVVTEEAFMDHHSEDKTLPYVVI